MMRVGAWQLSIADEGCKRGWHYDNPKHGDVISTMTIGGDGTVRLEAVPEETSAPAAEFQQSKGCFYTLFGVGLSSARHEVTAGNDGRVSVTFRYVD